MVSEFVSTASGGNDPIAHCIYDCNIYIYIYLISFNWVPQAPTRFRSERNVHSCRAMVKKKRRREETTLWTPARRLSVILSLEIIVRSLKLMAAQRPLELWVEVVSESPFFFFCGLYFMWYGSTSQETRKPSLAFAKTGPVPNSWKVQSANLLSIKLRKKWLAHLTKGEASTYDLIMKSLIPID